MVLSGMRAESVELLQTHKVDLKDFVKARVRYTTVLAEANSLNDDGAGHVAMKEGLIAAWEDYVQSVQLYLDGMVRGFVQDLTNPAPQTSTTGDEVPASPPPTTSPSTSTAAAKADKMNSFCFTCEKWFWRNEAELSLAEAPAVAKLTANAVSSPSRLMRLLGLRMAFLCAGSPIFLAALFEDRVTYRWFAALADRDFNAEVEGLLTFMERYLHLMQEPCNSFMIVPIGWLLRIKSMLNPSEQLGSMLPKKKALAIRVALLALKANPEKTIAVGLHTVLLSACVAKGGVSPADMRSIVKTSLDLFDHPSTRMWMGISDFSALFAPFLDTYTTTASSPDFLATLHTAKDLLAMVLSTWVGNLWVAAETTCLRSLIDVLLLPGDLDRKMVILELFHKVFVRLAAHRGLRVMEAWGGVEEDRRKRAAAAAAAAAAVTTDSPNSPLTSSLARTNSNVASVITVDNYYPSEHTFDEDEFIIPSTRALGFHVRDPLLGCVLLTLTYHGLPLALVSVMQMMGKNRSAMEASSRLLQDMFVLMDTVLPKETVFHLHETFNRTVGRFVNHGELFGGLTSQLFHSFSLGAREITGGLDGMQSMGGTSRPSVYLVLDTDASDELTEADNTVMNLLAETKVEQNPLNHAAWNYETLLLLIQSHLRNIRHLRMASSILAKILAFYTPRINRRTMFYLTTFSQLAPNVVTPQMCVLGVELIDLLLSSRDGTALLNNADFGQAVGGMLKEVRAGNPTILNKKTVESPMGTCLLRMAGRLTAHANGLVLMRQCSIFDIVDGLFTKLKGDRLNNPSEDDPLMDVCLGLLPNLTLSAVPNYGVCDEIRYTLRQALAHPSQPIRLCAALQLKKAVWRDLSTSMKWGIETLVRALHDDYFRVVESAFNLLLSICLSSEEGLDYLISLPPSIIMESEVILSNAKLLRLETLLYCIAKRPSGFRFLQCYGWVEKEVQRWESTQSARNVEMIEELQWDDGVSETGSPEGRKHHRSFSDCLSKVNPTSTSFIPLVTTSTVTSAQLFPVHIASVLCRTLEGCAMFKHSQLWTRSVARLLELHLPPSAAYCDAVSEQDEDHSGSTSEDEELLHLTGEVPHFVRQPKPSITSTNDGSPCYSAASPRSWEMAAHINNSSNLGGASADALAMDRAAAATDGRFGTSNAEVISAARGYDPIRSAYLLECTGDRQTLKEAILCVCEAASSDVGYSMMSSVPGLQQSILALARFASTVSVRCIAQIGCAIMARSKRAAEALTAQGYVVLHNPNAYVSADGIPYAVSFAQLKPPKAMSITKLHPTTGHLTSHFSHTELAGRLGLGVPKRIAENIYALCNPVSRENAKQWLYKWMKRQPTAFLEPNCQRLCLDASSHFQMRHEERKFLIDLLEHSRLNQQPSE